MRNWKVNKTLITGAIALLSLATGSAFAQTYVGIGVGASHANKGCGAADVMGAIDHCDKNDTAIKLYGGYQLPGTPWAGELTYFDLGKFKGSGTGVSSDSKGSYWGLAAPTVRLSATAGAASPASAPRTAPARWTTAWAKSPASTRRTAGIRTTAWA